MLEIRTFGGLALSCDGAEIEIGGVNQRRLVTCLLVSPSQRAHADRLIDCIWGDDPPANPPAALRTNVSRLRRALATATRQVQVSDTTASSASETILRTVDGGYELAITRVNVDLFQFESLLASGGDETRSQYERLATLDTACAISQGAPFGYLADLDWLRADVERIRERVLTANELRLELLIEQGRENEALGDLVPLITANPFREHLRQLELTALYRVGRTADGLSRISAYRTMLGDELGVGPSADLRELERRLVMQPDEAPSSDTVARVRGYELLERTGEGAYSIVWRARQPVLMREVAIKQIRAELANDRDFIRQFESEAQMVASLEHPHIVPLFDYWREPDSAFLVMRYLRGGSLAERLTLGRLTTSETQTLADQIGQALATAHDAGVAHGDLKTTNIMLDEVGNYFLGDFGIARHRKAPTFAADHARLIAADRSAFEQMLRHVATTPTGPAVFSRQKFVMPVNAAPIMELSPHQPELTFRNPYKGLRAFREADARDFFGRTRLAEELLERFGGGGVPVRLLAVVGPSGSGKSSLVFAGLLPRLRAGGVPTSQRWFITTMTPGNDPFDALTTALHSVTRGGTSDVPQLLRSGDYGLVEAGDTLLADSDGELLVVIDQFEELFTEVRDHATRQRFINLIVSAITHSTSRVRILLTMRADFWHHPLSYDPLGRLIEQAACHLTPMTRAELEEAVIHPALASGAQFEPGLAATIIADVRGQPGAIPLLQHTLRDLFERNRSGLLLRTDYEAMGGATGAIANRAELVFREVSAAHHNDAVRRLFLRLVSLGDGTEDTRRRVPIDELVGTGAEDAIDDFAEARLITFDRDSRTRTPTVEVAHEAILREWPRLRKWIDAARDDLRNIQHLTSAAREWHQNGRVDADLYRGLRLDAALRLSEDRAHELNDLERSFLAAGAAARDQDEASRRSYVRRLRRALAGAAAALVIACAVGLIAVVQANRAQAESERATLARLDAEVARLAADASQVAATQPRLGLLLAAEAYARDPSVETLGALQRVLIRTGPFLGALGVGHDYQDVSFSADGRLVFARRLGAVDAFDVDTRRLSWSTPVNGGGPVAVSPQNEIAVATDKDGIAVLSITSGDSLRTIRGDGVVVLVYNQQGNRLVTGNRAGWLEVWDLEGDRVMSAHAHPETSNADLPVSLQVTEADRHIPREVPIGIRGLALDEAGDRIVTTGAFFVRTWRLDDLGPLVEARLSEDSPTGAGERIRSRAGDVVVPVSGTAVVATTASVQLFDLETGGKLADLDPSPLTQAVASERGVHISHSPDGTTVVITDLTGGIAALDTQRQQIDYLRPLSVRARSGRSDVPRSAVHPSGKFAAFATGDGLRLRALNGDSLTSTLFPGLISEVADGSWRSVLSASDGQTLLIEDTNFEPALYDVARQQPRDTAALGDTIFIWLDTIAPVGWLDTDFTLHLAADLDLAEAQSITNLPSLAWAARSPDGTLLAAGSLGTDEGPDISIFDVATGRLVAELLAVEQSGDTAVFDLAWSPDGTRLLSTHRSGEAIVWDTTTWAIAGPPIAPAGSAAIEAAAYSPDGEHLVTVKEGVLNVRDASTNQPTGITLPAAFGSALTLNANRLAFSGDGDLLLATFGAPVLIDTSTWSLIGDPFPQSGDAAVQATVGARFVATTEGSAVRLWDLNVADWPALACKATGGGFSDVDWREYGTDTGPVLDCEEWSG